METFLKIIFSSLLVVCDCIQSSRFKTRQKSKKIKKYKKKDDPGW